MSKHFLRIISLFLLSLFSFVFVTEAVHSFHHNDEHCLETDIHHIHTYESECSLCFVSFPNHTFIHNDKSSSIQNFEFYTTLKFFYLSEKSFSFDFSILLRGPPLLFL